jgi:uncharacterized membrane protein
MNCNQASKCLFHKSQRRLIGAIALSFCFFILTIITFFDIDRTTENLLVVVMAIIQVSQLGLKYGALYWFSLGDEARRMEQLEIGLGYRPSDVRSAAIEQITGPCNAKKDPNYWLTQKAEGPSKLVEMILESSFYTSDLAKRCKTLYLGIGVVGMILTVTAIVMTLQSSSSQLRTDRITHVIIAAFVFFLTGDFWLLGFQYRDLAEHASSSSQEAYKLAERFPASNEDAIELLMTYNAAVAQAPPLISLFHKWKRQELDNRFKRHFSRVMGLSFLEPPTV